MYFGHGLQVTRLLYDEQLSLFGMIEGDEGGDDFSIYTAYEFLSVFPYFTNNLNLFYSIDSTKIIVNYGENSIWDLTEAFTDTVALAHGVDFVTGFYFDSGEWSAWRDGQRWRHSSVAVQSGDNWGILDIDGNVVAPFVFEHAIAIDDSTAFVFGNPQTVHYGT